MQCLQRFYFLFNIGPIWKSDADCSLKLLILRVVVVVVGLGGGGTGAVL